MIARQLVDGLRSRFFLAFVLLLSAEQATAQETPCGKGMTEANKEYLIIDDMEDVADWYNGSPEETRLSTSDKQVQEGKSSLLFSNVVDHNKGEEKYPVGWPRTGKRLSKTAMTDWSGYDSFECWIYVDTSRDALPGVPLGLGIRHSGHKRSSDFPLKEVAKNAWTKITIPMTRISDPRDVQSIQFHISEANYKHGDRVDFYIDQMVLTRFVEPAISELSVDRKILYASDRSITAFYRLVGYQGLDDVSVEVEIGRESTSVAKGTARAARQAELPLKLATAMSPGNYWVRLNLRDKSGKLLDRQQSEVRVIPGPF